MRARTPKGIVFIFLLLTITANIIVTDVYAQMPDTTPRMPDTTPRMPRDLFNQVFGVLVRLPSTLFRMPDTTPRMPDTTPQMPDTTPRMPGWLSNFFSAIRKFLAPPSPSNLPQPLGQWQQEPTKKATPTPRGKGTPQIGPYTYKPEGEAAKAGVPSFTIAAPSGWSSLGISGSQLAHFESEELDTEKVKGGEITTNAVIIVRATGGYESLDDFYNQYKASGKSVPGYQLLSSSNNRLEFKFKTKVDGQEITLRELDYLFFKDGISFLVKGYAADSAWSKNAGQIQSALNSFKFK
ncbi:hypothetical protein A3A84_02975 [Candidatus Collierbacteria bacterium RIFCSPLOWO2_01_FULL_50_23]|nr:MAG: hypothetical protein A3A84_02975 [Candidatus Collierbacteria bacterium RIFCSPLOWO2_01_FULL_50_23]